MTKTWSVEDDTPLRRYSTHGAPYQSHDRFSAAGHHDGPRNSTRAYSYAPPDEQEGEPDPKSRRRIPVACGRCRKRKIKCSGPIGDNSCTNCKTAGSSDCQFNRVSSEELPFRDATVEFNYNPELARAVHVRACSPSTAYRPHTPAYAQPNMMALPYMCRPDYYPAKYVSLYTGAEFGEDGLDYAISNHTYSMYGQEHAGGSSSTYGPHAATRTWTPIATPARPYFDQEEASYSQSQLQYGNASYGLRSNGNTESNNFSFSGMANSLPSPAPIITNDRVLPMPAVPRSTTGTNPSRSADTMPYMGPPLRTYHDHPIQMAGAATSPIGYVPLTSSPTAVDSYTISAANGNAGPHHQEIYNASENWAPPPLANDPTHRNLEGSADQYYRHSSQSPRRPSQSRKSTSGGGQSSPPTVNTQRTPYGQETAEPSRIGLVDLGRGAIHRRSTGSLQAA